jgi:Rrf2 family protein
MKFSAQEEFGLRCLLVIARNPRGSTTIPEISRAEGITMPHVAKLLSILRKEGFIQSTRGQAGGYSLADAPQNINVGRVLEALGGRLYEDDFCERHSGQLDACAHTGSCAIKGLWSSVQQAVDRVLDNVMLSDLLRMEQDTRAPIKLHPARPTVGVVGDE